MEGRKKSEGFSSPLAYKISEIHKKQAKANEPSNTGSLF